MAIIEVKELPKAYELRQNFDKDGYVLTYKEIKEDQKIKIRKVKAFEDYSEPPTLKECLAAIEDWDCSISANVPGRPR